MASDIGYTSGWIDGFTPYTTSTANDYTITTWPSWPQPISIEDDCGQPCIVLHNAKSEVVGRVYLGNGNKDPLEFFGDISKSTEVFMTALRSATEDYLKTKHEQMAREIISDLEKAEKSIAHFNNERSGAISSIADTIKSYIAGLKLAI